MTPPTLRETKFSRAKLLALLLVSLVSVVGVSAFEPENIGFKLAALVLFLICAYKGSREHYAFNPFYMFSLTPLSLVFYNKEFSSYYLQDLDDYTYVLALLSIAAFIIGLSAIRVSPRERASRRVREDALFYPLLVLGMLPVAYGISLAPGVLLSGDVLGMKDYMSLMPMSSILSFCRYPALALALKSKRRGRAALALACCAFALALQFNKTNLVFLVMTLLVTIQKYCLSSPRAKLVFRALCAACAVALVLSVTFYDEIRSDYDSTEALIRTGTKSFLPDFLLLPYMYLECSWSNLQYVIDTQPAHTFGLWLIRPLLFYLRADGQFADAYTLVPSSSYNTYTFITVQWKDFGLLGSILISLALGLFVSYVYQSSRRSDSPFLAAAYALNAVAVLEMFFSNHFFYLVYPFTAFLIALVCDVLVDRGGGGLAERGASRASGRGPLARRGHIA